MATDYKLSDYKKINLYSKSSGKTTDLDLVVYNGEAVWKRPFDGDDISISLYGNGTGDTVGVSVKNNSDRTIDVGIESNGSDMGKVGESVPIGSTVSNTLSAINSSLPSIVFNTDTKIYVYGQNKTSLSKGYSPSLNSGSFMRTVKFVSSTGSWSSGSSSYILGAQLSTSGRTVGFGDNAQTYSPNVPANQYEKSFSFENGTAKVDSDIVVTATSVFDYITPSISSVSIDTIVDKNGDMLFVIGNENECAISLAFDSDTSGSNWGTYGTIESGGVANIYLYNINPDLPWAVSDGGYSVYVKAKNGSNQSYTSGYSNGFSAKDWQ